MADIMKLGVQPRQINLYPYKWNPARHIKLRDSREDSLLTTGWVEDLANEMVFIFKTLKEMKLCTFLHNTMEAQGASADNCNCHILHALLGNSITDFTTSRNQ